MREGGVEVRARGYGFQFKTCLSPPTSTTIPHGVAAARQKVLKGSPEGKLFQKFPLWPPEASVNEILRVENLEVVYNDVVLVLKGLSLACPEGRITALLGANGAGKSTTLKAISGLLQCEDGEVTDGAVVYRGEPIQGLVPERIVRKGIFQVMEGRRIFEDLTVEENLRCGAFTRPRGEMADSLALVYEYFPRLKERRKQLAGYMSGGEQQMCAIGRAVMAKPRLLLLDEPSLGLAPLLVEEIFDIIKRFNQKEGVTCPWPRPPTSWRTAAWSWTARPGSCSTTPTSRSSTWAWATQATKKATATLSIIGEENAGLDK
jgi:branched-chain amino acid transport system ATP-binding protein